jgi:hypothetical protein
MATNSPVYQPGTLATQRYVQRVNAPDGPSGNWDTIRADEFGNAGTMTAQQIAQLMRYGGYNTDGSRGVGSAGGVDTTIGPSSWDLLAKNAGAAAPASTNWANTALAGSADALRAGTQDVGGNQANAFADAYARAAGSPLTAVAAPQTTLNGLQGDVNTVRGFANGAPTAATTQFNQGLAQAMAQQKSNAASIAGAQGGAALQNANEANIGIAGQGAQALAAQQAAEQLNAQGQLVQGNAALGAAGQALSTAAASTLNPDQQLALQQQQQRAEQLKAQNWATNEGLRGGATTGALSAGENNLAWKQAQDAVVTRRRQAYADALLRHLGVSTGAPAAIQPLADKATIANNERTANTVGADISAAGNTGLIFARGSGDAPGKTGSIDTTNPYA